MLMVPTIKGFPAWPSYIPICLHDRAGRLRRMPVQEGDTIFGISDRFDLNPSTVMWSNYYTLGDNPHALTPGQS